MEASLMFLVESSSNFSGSSGSIKPGLSALRGKSDACDLPPSLSSSGWNDSLSPSYFNDPLSSSYCNSSSSPSYFNSSLSPSLLNDPFPNSPSTSPIYFSGWINKSFSLPNSFFPDGIDAFLTEPISSGDRLFPDLLVAFSSDFYELTLSDLFLGDLLLASGSAAYLSVFLILLQQYTTHNTKPSPIKT